MNAQAGMVFSDIRLLTEADLPSVLDVQRESYDDALIEDEAVFLERLRVFPAGMLGAFSGDGLAGYAVCHPWSYGRTVPLNTSSLTLPDNSDCLYIHDVAVRPFFRGGHVGGWLVAAAMEVGIVAGLRRFTLTAVQSSEGFWERFGFRPSER
ncbi:MAG: GNAT family N-acetyltransferase, partial [bacterium]|nr:GNAT family N-acetyltransferase [bacterium]